MTPLNILFLSTGNAARSILAEALLNRRGSEKFVARSAGISPLPTVHTQTLEILSSHGFEIESLHTKSWLFFQKAVKPLAPNIVVTLSEEAGERRKLWPEGTLVTHWVVDNPLSAARSDVREWKFRKCFSVLEARIAALSRTRLSPSADELLLQFKEIGAVV